MPANPEGKALLQRVHLGRGEVWALAAAFGYALYQVFLGAAMQGEVHNVVAIKAEGEVTRAEREKHLGQKGVTIWLTGLSASGKSTVARLVAAAAS